MCERGREEEWKCECVNLMKRESRSVCMCVCYKKSKRKCVNVRVNAFQLSLFLKTFMCFNMLISLVLMCVLNHLNIEFRTAK